METDDIFERYADEGKANLSLSLIPRDEEEEFTVPLVLIQGPPRGLRLLGELLIAIANSEDERDGHASPTGAGSYHFASSSELGFYINRLDE
jgi:hypothetical protein